jgi:hypothetical protein
MKEKILAILGVLGLSIVIFIPEFFIYYNHEAREDWGRMLPCAIIGPLMFYIACALLVVGVILIRHIFIHLVAVAKGENCLELVMLCGATIGCLASGGGTIYRWIKFIIIDNYPAFGYNPDNVYAVAGLNTVVFLPTALFVGVLLGAILGGLVSLMAVSARLFVK